MSAVRHHWDTIRRSLDAERERLAKHMTSSEVSYLPAALEVIERPVSPTARASSWVLLTGVALTIGWSVLGHVDIVATAPGRVMPTDDVKLVQAVNAGVVRRIYVHEGDAVRRGQRLVDLDPTVSTAEEVQAEKALLTTEIDAARDQAIVDGLGGKPPHFTAPAGTPADVERTQRMLISAQIAAVSAETAGLSAARTSAISDAKAAGAQMHAYGDTLLLLDHELTSMNELAAQGYAPGLKLMEMQRQRRSELGSREVAAAQQTRGMSDASKFSQQISQTREQAEQQALTDLSKAQSDVMLRRAEVTKARQRSSMQRLVAPTDGTVQQIAVHTLGGVVESVRPLMVVVPNGGVIVEAHILNRDAGFVRVGQSAVVKLEAFPFTRYGSMRGHIVSIGRDAVQDPRTGSYYVARISLESRTIKTDEGTVVLTSGLNATTDIRIGSRRIIDYLLSPLSSHFQEAGREQ